jgi:hypothetical protein
VCYPEDAHCLTEDPRIRHITFIGSEQVARKVAVSAAKNLIPCTMELGGKVRFGPFITPCLRWTEGRPIRYRSLSFDQDPAIILPSANIEKYASYSLLPILSLSHYLFFFLLRSSRRFESTFMRATFQSMGQGCIATGKLDILPAPPPCHAQLSRFPINTDLISHPTSIADVSLTERCRTLPRPPYSPPPIPPQHLQSHLPTPDRIVPLSPIFLFRFRPDRRRQPNHHGPLRAPQRTHRFGSKGGSPDHLRREASASSREEWRRRSVLQAYADCGQGGNRD